MTSSLLSVTAADVLAFWREAGPSRWFRKDDAFDHEFRARFLGSHEAAARGELDHWAQDAQGALALVILLDQFPRNAFRGTARMFESDAKAREIARAAIESGFDEQAGDLRNFFYMPFMHSERLPDQDLCVQLSRKAGDDNTRRYAELHRDIIERFGRFPHRNAVLDRTSTPEEQRFLEDGGFAG
jgi:uncharacterized protein (DUF924 family)